MNEAIQLNPIIQGIESITKVIDYLIKCKVGEEVNHPPDPEMPEQSVQEEEDYDGRTLFHIRRLTNVRVRVSPLVIEIIIST